MGNTLNLDNLSPKNLMRIDKVLRAVLDELELKGGEGLFGYKISIKVLEREGIFYDEAVAVLNKIDCVKVRNWEFRQSFNNRVVVSYEIPSTILGYTEKDLDEYLFLYVRNLNELKGVAEEVHKKVEKIDKNERELSRKSEALRALEALNEMESIRFGMIDAPKPELTEAEKASLRTKSQERVIEEIVKNSEPTNKKITAKKSNKKDPIRKILIIKMNDGKQLVSVNDGKETRAIRGYAESWKILEKEIKDRNIDQEQRTGVKDISDAVVDYFNTNKRCPIYMGGKYTLTDVIVGRDIRGISPAITTRIMTEKEYMTLKKRKSKKLKRA